jgi:hypothetical protein
MIGHLERPCIQVGTIVKISKFILNYCLNIGKSLVAAKAVVVKKHSNDDEKCRHNGLRLIVMVWETFDGSTLKTRIMICKIAIRHADKHNRPQGQTIYQINQRLSVVLQRGVGEQLIACECTG